MLNSAEKFKSDRRPVRIDPKVLMVNITTIDSMGYVYIWLLISWKIQRRDWQEAFQFASHDLK